MTSSLPPPPPSSDAPPPSMSGVLDELARLRARVASEDRVAILDSIRRIDRDLRALERLLRSGVGDHAMRLSSTT